MDVQWLDSVEAMLQQGKAVQIANWGEQAGLEFENSLARQMVPEAAELVDGYHFGQVWARADLNPRERMVLRPRRPDVPGPLEAAKASRRLRLGHRFGPQGICEVFAQAGWYRGWPCVEDALGTGLPGFPGTGVLNPAPNKTLQQPTMP